MKDTQTIQTGRLHVRTDIKAGYWTCTGVKGAQNMRGVFQHPRASVCYKPKYAPIYGAPASYGGDESEN
jgi:hypothetical protein